MAAIPVPAAAGAEAIEAEVEAVEVAVGGKFKRGRERAFYSNGIDSR